MVKHYAPVKEYEVDEDMLLRRAFTCDEVRAIDKENRLIDFIISTDHVDRMGDVITASGWQLKEYRRNPIVLFAHNSKIPPIGRATKIAKVEGALTATAQFMEREMSEFADSIYQMYLGGYMKAVSVGFRPLEWERMYDEEDDDRFLGYKFLKQELLEFSAVPIPANPNALMGAKSAGIDVLPFKHWAESVLDNWDDGDAFLLKSLGIRHKDVENIYKDSGKAHKRSLIRSSKTKRDEGRIMFDNLETVSKEIEDKAGDLVLESIEDNGEVTIEVLEAPEYIKCAKEIVENSAELKVTEDEDGDQLITLSAMNGEVTYKVIGSMKDGDRFVAQMTKTSLELPSGSGTASKTQSTEEAEDEKVESASEEEQTDSDEIKEEESTEEKTETTQESVKDEDSEEKFEMDFACMERALDDFEEFLDSREQVGLTKQDMRKVKYLAIYLDDTVSRLKSIAAEDKKEEGRTTDARKKSTTNGHDKDAFYKLEDVVAVLEKKLPGQIESAVDKALNKATGRLD